MVNRTTPDSRTSDTARRRIYQTLRRAIIMGHLRPNERLPIGDLAEQHQTSVTPVRDALQMLSQEGLVTIKPRSGYFVARITLKQLRDMLELREILELASVERAAIRITVEQLAQLEQVHRGYTGDDDESYERYTDENRTFHTLIASASGNQELARVLGHLLDQLARYMVMRHAGETQAGSHLRLIAALRARDVAAARQVLLHELDDTRDAVLERVMQEESDSWQLGS